ncbi:conserved hypothetical protein [Lactococcus piscium]|nr:conserved hypothetical protein [Lactococcus piscium]
MALTTKQTVSLIGESRVNGQTIASFTAQIPQQADGNSSVNLYVADQALYNFNRTEVRKDQAEFQAKVYEVEDEIAQEQTGTEENGV